MHIYWNIAEMWLFSQVHLGKLFLYATDLNTLLLH